MAFVSSILSSFMVGFDRVAKDQMCHFIGWSLASFNSLIKLSSFHHLNWEQNFISSSRVTPIQIHILQNPTWARHFGEKSWDTIAALIIFWNNREVLFAGMLIKCIVIAYSPIATILFIYFFWGGYWNYFAIVHCNLFQWTGRWIPLPS